MFVPNQEAWEDIQWDDVNLWEMENIEWENVAEESQIILPEIDSENPESTEAPILITEDGEIDEMDQTFEVQLENGETELVRQWDLWDSIQIEQ